MSGKNNSAINITAGHFILYLCTFAVPVFLSWTIFMNLQVFTISDTKMGLSSPVSIFGLAAVFGFVFYWWFSSGCL